MPERKLVRIENVVERGGESLRARGKIAAVSVSSLLLLADFSRDCEQ